MGADPVQRAAAADAEPASLGAIARLALRHARVLAVDYALLAVLDARRAATTLAWLLSAGLAVALLAVTAWLALVAGGIVWAIGEGASWPVALAIAALLNVVAAIALAFWVRGRFDELPFAATLRQLKGDPPAESAQ